MKGESNNTISDIVHPCERSPLARAPGGYFKHIPTLAFGNILALAPAGASFLRSADIAPTHASSPRSIQEHPNQTETVATMSNSIRLKSAASSLACVRPDCVESASPLASAALTAPVILSEAKDLGRGQGPTPVAVVGQMLRFAQHDEQGYHPQNVVTRSHSLLGGLCFPPGGKGRIVTP